MNKVVALLTTGGTGSMTASIGFLPPKVLLTTSVVPTKPAHRMAPETMPFFTVTWPGPRWPMAPAST